MPRKSKVYTDKHVGFAPFALAALFTISLTRDEYPTRVFSVDECNFEQVDQLTDSTLYGIVTEGFVTTWAPNDVAFVLGEGQYFCLPVRANETLFIDGTYGKALIIERMNYYGYPQAGGPLEEAGRLKYIDGCSDTLLICPPVVGEPCLNHLHIPHATDQTAHTHPSQRIGVIAKGSGYCLTPYESGQILLPEQAVTTHLGALKTLTPLKAGMGWWIPTGLLHSFHTLGDSLDVVAWHPDSDFGPTHDNHPMVNRTYVNDVASSQIAEIRTTEISA